MEIRIPAAAVRKAVLACTAGAALCLAGSVIVQGFGAPLRRFSWWGVVASQISLGGERSIVVAFASLLLLLVAAAFVLAYLAERSAAGPGSTKSPWPWLVIAAGFAGLSLDEAGSVHERIGTLQQLNALGGAALTWVGVLALPVAACAAALGVFAWRRLRHQPLLLVLMVGGMALLASVLLQEEVEVRTWNAREAAAAAAGTVREQRPWYMLVLEEGSELAGSLMFLSAALIHAHRVGNPQSRQRWFGGVEARVERKELRAATIGVPVVLAAGLASAAVFQRSLPLDDSHGIPAPWFAATMALFAGAAALLLPRGATRLAPRVVLAGACFAWALEQGAVYLLTDNIWRGSPRMQLATLVALAAATFGVAVLLARSSLPERVRRRIVVWGGLAAIAPLSGHPLAITALLLIAHAALFVSLMETYLESDAPAAGSAPGERLHHPLTGAPVPPLRP